MYLRGSRLEVDTALRFYLAVLRPLSAIANLSFNHPLEGPFPRATFTGQKVKMLAGELYLASDPELVADRLCAPALLASFNATATDAEEERRLLLMQLLGSLGQGAVLKPTPPVRLWLQHRGWQPHLHHL